MKLLSRDQFREGVFSRDEHKCVICGDPAKDAHHIIERRLFSDGGYYLDNGASLCQTHHIQAEETTIGCDLIREKCNIQTIILPEHLDTSHKYDKWGNIILPSGQRLKGELFYDESVQKIMAQGGFLDIFQKYVKYPRTYHLPWSNLEDDDKMLMDDSQFIGKRVVCSLKMDGENCLGPNTVLITDDGEKTIKDICDSSFLGKVLSYDIDTGEIEFQDIVAHNISKTSKLDQWFEIELENGFKIEITGSHYVYVENLECYRKVIDLEEGDDVKFLL